MKKQKTYAILFQEYQQHYWKLLKRSKDEEKEKHFTETYISLSMELVEEGKYLNALKLLDTALNSYPRNKNLIDCYDLIYKNSKTKTKKQKLDEKLLNLGHLAKVALEDSEEDTIKNGIAVESKVIVSNAPSELYKMKISYLLDSNNHIEIINNTNSDSSPNKQDVYITGDEHLAGA